MLCNRCMVVMKSGTSYQHKNGRDTAKRYDECPKCHDKKYNNSPNFQDMLVNASQKHSSK